MRAGIAASALRGALPRHATAWLYLAGVCAAELTYALLPGHDRDAVLAWSSTSVHNLEHHPVGSLVASAFFPTTFLLAWPAVITLAMFAATSVLGAWRTALTCAAGQVVGTMVSEGIVAYRVAHGSLPPADRFLLDVGPSYVVMAAIAVALLYGRWPARAAAAVDLVALVFVGQIFAGLSRLEVAAVGHLTALTAGAVTATLFVWHQRKSSGVK
jgi:Rhomboid-like protein